MRAFDDDPRIAAGVRARRAALAGWSAAFFDAVAVVVLGGGVAALALAVLALLRLI